jgi:hypothetical protein
MASGGSVLTVPWQRTKRSALSVRISQPSTGALQGVPKEEKKADRRACHLQITIYILRREWWCSGWMMLHIPAAQAPDPLISGGLAGCHARR